MMIIGFDISTHVICISPTIVRIFVLSCFNFVNATINFLDIASYFNCNNCVQRQISVCVSHRANGWGDLSREVGGLGRKVGNTQANLIFWRCETFIARN